MKRKSYLLSAGILLLALFVIFIFSFFSAKTVKPAVVLELRYWFTDEAADNFTGRDETIPSEQAITGCTGSTYDCEYGYLASDFQVTGYPSSGLKSGHLPPYVIKFD